MSDDFTFPTVFLLAKIVKKTEKKTFKIFLGKSKKFRRLSW